MYSGRIGDVIEFFAPGQPVPQGSKKISFRGKWPVLIDDNANELKRWRRRVALLAASEMRGRPLIEGEVQMRLVFYLYRPKSAKPTDTPTAAKVPDWDKLERAVGDALTGVVFRNDAQVTWCFTRKVVAAHGKPMGVHIAVRPAHPPPDTLDTVGAVTQQLRCT